MATSVTIPVSTDGHGPVYVTTLAIGAGGVAATQNTVAVSHGETAGEITVTAGTAVLITSALVHGAVTAPATVGQVDDAVSGDVVDTAEPAPTDAQQTVLDSEAV